jgi:hypothetical protein
MRTTRTTMTFARPFILRGVDQVLPSGSHEVETDEELLEGVSFLAYRRVLTLLHLRPDGRPGGVTQTLVVDPGDLDAALQRDKAATAPLATAS